MTITITRTLVIYFLIVCVMRLLGKKQLRELQPSELVSTILISNLASIPIENTNVPILSCFIPILIICCLEIFISALGMKNRAVEKLISGQAKTIIKDGVIVQKTLEELRFTVDDLLEALRSKDVFDINDVSYAIVETNGLVNVFKNEKNIFGFKKRAKTPSRPTVPLIVSGVVNYDMLDYSKKNYEWLCDILVKKKLKLDEILLLTLDDSGQITTVKKEV